MSAKSGSGSDSPYEVAIEEREGWSRRLTITVAPERVARTRVAERAKLARSLNLKGFRRGKVPPQIVEQRFGDLLNDRAMRALVDEAYRDVVRQQGLRPVGDPSVGNVQYTPGESLTFQVELEVMPTLDLERIGGFRLKRPTVEVKEEEVDRIVEGLREEHATWEPTDVAPQLGDMVSVRIAPAGQDGGAPAEEPKPYRFRLGEGQAIPDVESAIRSLRPGEAGTFDVAFPQNFADAERAGSRKPLHIELISVAVHRRPEVNDAFASATGGFESVEAMRAAIRQDLARHHEQEADAFVRNQILDSIIEANPFVVPRAMVDDLVGRMLEVPEGADPQEVEKVRESLRSHAEREIRRNLVVDHLIEREGLAATAEEVEARIAELAEREGKDAAEVRRRLRKERRLPTLERQVAVEKLFDYLKSQSTVG